MASKRISILIKRSSLVFDKLSNQLLTPTNPTVTGLVQKLEAKDLVKRMPHPEDKRSKVLVLTDRAVEMKEELLALADSLEQQMTANLTAEEYDQLAILLTKMLKHD